MKYLNTSDKYGEKRLLPIEDYRKLNPQGTFVVDGFYIYEVNESGLRENVATELYNPIDLMKNQKVAAIANVVWRESEMADEPDDVRYYIEMFETLIGLCPDQSDKLDLRIFAQKLEDWIEEMMHE